MSAEADHSGPVIWPETEGNGINRVKTEAEVE